ncbi:hypothetical protein WH7805_01702 [Synechococcus sp. WH 7805]|nr:hypothetical protein WH7805_01702 [Synechococcus sp. WH 7805]
MSLDCSLILGPGAVESRVRWRFANE